ncbi:MAG: RecX family transcriptional regulator [Clostridia bacterium]|nr:RecX family transcriptional regulator [Clostridia bacterium]
MPKVTKLEVQKSNKGRVNVYVDDEFYCGMEAVTALAVGLKEGREVTTLQLQSAIFDSEVSVAFGKAVDYISRYMKTSRQLSQYLLRKGFSQEVCQTVVAKLLDYGYVDDARYAQLYTEQNNKSKGARRIKQELLAKGVDKANAELYSQVDGEQALQSATNLAQKYMKGKSCDTPTLVKLQRYLAYRGFDFDVINSVVGNYRNFDE